MEPITIDAIAELFSAKFAEFEATLVRKYGLQERPPMPLLAAIEPQDTAESPLPVAVPDSNPMAPEDLTATTASDLISGADLSPLRQPDESCSASSVLSCSPEGKTIHLFSAASSLVSAVAFAEIFPGFFAILCQAVVVFAGVSLVVGSPVTILPGPKPPPSVLNSFLVILFILSVFFIALFSSVPWVFYVVYCFSDSILPLLPLFSVLFPLILLLP